MPGRSTNYRETLILTAGDCPRRQGTVPARQGSVAALQYQLLAKARYRLTSDDLLWRVALLRDGSLSDTPEDRERYFASDRACLRASPLVKSYGWGIHHDREGRIALVGCESDDYRRLERDPAVTKLAGLRSRRA